MKSVFETPKKEKKCFNQSIIDAENGSFTGVLKECPKFYSLLANLISNLQKYLQKEPTMKDCPGIITVKKLFTLLPPGNFWVCGFRLTNLSESKLLNANMNMTSESKSINY